MPQDRNPEMAGGEKDTQQAANQLKQAAAPARQQAQNNAPPQGVQLVDPRLAPAEVPSYATEDEEFLFGMTDKPDEPVNFGVTSSTPLPPKSAYRYLGLLAQAAEDPGAPRELFEFMRILQESLSA